MHAQAPMCMNPPVHWPELPIRCVAFIPWAYPPSQGQGVLESIDPQAKHIMWAQHICTSARVTRRKHWLAGHDDVTTRSAHIFD